MLPVAEFALPGLDPILRSSLGLAGEPFLRRVALESLQAVVVDGGMEPGKWLSQAEQVTLAGLTYPKRRWEWLGGRLAAKAAALAWAGQPLAAAGLAGWQVVNAADGRPGLQRVGVTAEGTMPQLSISHSHGVAAGLVVAERPCGLDLQRVTATVVRVRERFCTEAEAALLPEGDAPPEFGLTLLWTAKEALRKARGGVPLTGFLAMQLAGVEKLAEQVWCFRLAVAGAAEFPVVVFLSGDFAWAVSVR